MTDAGEPLTESLQEVGRGLRDSVDRIREALLAVVRQAAQAVGAEESSILVPTVPGDALRFLVSHSPHAEELADLRVAVTTTVAGRVFTTAQMIAVEDTPPSMDIPGDPPRVYLAYPLTLGETTLGVATYVNRPGPPPYTQFDRNELRTAARFAVVQAFLLRHYLRLSELAADAARELTACVDGAGAVLADLAETTDLGDDSWRMAVTELSRLGDHDMQLCARLVELVREWSDGELE